MFKTPAKVNESSNLETLVRLVRFIIHNSAFQKQVHGC